MQNNCNCKILITLMLLIKTLAIINLHRWNIIPVSGSVEFSRVGFNDSLNSGNLDYWIGTAEA